MTEPKRFIPAGSALKALKSGGVSVRLLLLMMALVAPARAQTPPPPAGGTPPAQAPSPQALMAEYQQVQSRLGRLQAQVIQADAELEARRSGIDELVTAAMNEIDPETDAHIARLEVLSQEAMEAQRAQDSAVMETLMTEVASLRSALGAAQAAAIQRDDVQREIQSFEADLMLKVAEVDPEAPQLLARLEELEEILSAGGPGSG